MSDRMPIYRVKSEGEDVPRLVDLAKRVFDIDGDYRLTSRGNSRILRAGHRVVEIAGESGGVWAADEAQLWKPASRPRLPSEEQAATRAEDTLKQSNLWPRLHPHLLRSRPKLCHRRTRRS